MKGLTFKNFIITAATFTTIGIVGAPELTAQEPNDILIAVRKAINELCARPSESGTSKIIEFRGEAGVKIKLVDIGGEINLSQEEWEGFAKVIPEQQYIDNVSSRECSKELVPQLLEIYKSQHKDLLAKEYQMDIYDFRRIIVTHLNGDQYRAEEPGGQYPWKGTVTLDGGILSGEARFRRDKDRLVTFRIIGQIRGDRSIEIKYEYLTDRDGNPSIGRVDEHVWYPIKSVPNCN